MKNQVLKAADLTIERVEELFQAAMYPIEEHPPFSEMRIGCFTTRDNDVRILIGVNTDYKVITFQSELILPIKNHQWTDCHWKMLNTLSFRFPMLRPTLTLNSILFDYAMPYELGVYMPSVIGAFRLFAGQLFDAIRISSVFFSVTGPKEESKLVHLDTDNIDDLFNKLIGDGIAPGERYDDEHESE